MRFWLAALLLFGVCALAVVWQGRWTSGLRAQRDLAWERAEVALAAAPEPASAPFARSTAPEEPLWARVVVGRPSGAPPVAAPEPEPGAPLASADGAHEEDPGQGATLSTPDFTMTVRPGQSLSVICKQHYGSARKDLVQRLAEYNGLANPDQLRVGVTLQLPAEPRLFPTPQD